MMAEIVSLTLYPASAVIRQQVEREFGLDALHVDLSGLRAHGLRRLIPNLRKLACGTVVVPIETLNDESLSSIMKLIASFVPARQRFLFLRDHSRRQFGFVSLIAGLLAVARATVQGFVALSLNWYDAKRLLKAPRIAISPHKTQNTVAYLYGNFTVGLKAGGAYGHIAGVANGLMDRGYGLEFYFIDDGPLVDGRAVRKRIALPNALSVPLTLNSHRANRLAVARMMPELSSRHAFIYQRLSLANIAGVLLSRAKNIPLIVEYNGSDVWGSVYWGHGLKFAKICTAMENVLLRHAHLVVTISDPLREELIQRGVEPGRIVTYPNGIEPAMFAPVRFDASANRTLRAKWDLAPEDKVVFFLGTFGRWHGAEVFAEAIRNLVRNDIGLLRTLRLKFMFVGDGLTMPLVREILSAPACAEFVRFTGTVPQVEGPTYLAISDICIAPHVPNADGTKFFGSPTKLFEYMAMGKAIIASDLDQIGEVLRPAVDIGGIDELPAPQESENRLAILTTPGNAPELARAILFLAQSPDWRETLGRNARAEALKKYTWDIHVGKIMDGFRRAADL